MRYLEDFSAGQSFTSGRLHVERNRIKAFAAEFDPQPLAEAGPAARAGADR